MTETAEAAAAPEAAEAAPVSPSSVTNSSSSTPSSSALENAGVVPPHSGERRLRRDLLPNQQKRRDLEQRYYESRLYCADLIQKFAVCAWGRTVTVAWACKQENAVMLKCMQD